MSNDDCLVEDAPHIVLVNAWHDDNKGDSAITAGVIRLAESAFPGSSLTVVGLTEGAAATADGMRHVARAHPRVQTLPMPIPTELRGHDHATPAIDVPIWLGRLVAPTFAALRGRPHRGYARIFADADLVIGVGGSNLYTDTSVHPLVSMARLFTLSVPIQTAGRLAIPTVLLGHTLGPFPSSRPVTARVARRMLHGADVTVVRDGASLQTADVLGLPNAELAPDMAYAIEPVVSERVSTIIDDQPAPMHRTVVVAMRSHPSLGADSDARVCDEVVRAVTELRRGGLIDHVLVVAHTLGPTEIEDDRPISRTLTTMLAEQRVPATYLDADLGPEELAGLYGRAAAMIAVRLHAAVLAMLSGTPTFAIAYFSSKSAGVMTSAGLADCVGEFADVTANEIVGALEPRMTDPGCRKRLARTSREHRDHLISRAAEWLRGARPHNRIRERTADRGSR
ncbi:polysaccharide pyruvyl transferase family protein [Gordonia sp. CPCC 206044]|uniref:polysaccharide pyruvyl transferase family protein n=1 Tax=Gordonia sp. CPCC 206044 TaxID=3140793 RepID=UPI003AF3B681